MHRIDTKNNVDGLFTDSPPATIVGPDWLNAVQEEIATVIENAGIALSDRESDQYDQLSRAISLLGRKFHEPSSDSIYLQITNNTTGQTSSDGILFGMDASENAIWNNQENTGLSIIRNSNTILNVDASNNLDIDGATIDLQIGGVNALSINASREISSDLNIASGNEIQHDGTPAIGYLDDGTPLYAKLLTGTITSSSIDVYINHSISNAYTNSRILGLTAHLQNTSGPLWGQVYLNAFRGLAFTSYNDTQVRVVQGSTGGSSVSVMVFLIYK